MKCSIVSIAVLVFAIISLLITGCGPSEEAAGNSYEYILKPTEVTMCIEEGVDTAVIKVVRQSWRTTLRVLTPDSVLFENADGNYMWVRSSLHGVMFEAGPEIALSMVERYCDTLRKLNHIIYIFQQFKDLEGSKDLIAVVKGKDQYDILKESGTDGSNYDIDNDSLISIIHSFDLKYDLILTGVGMDWCQFSIGKEPTDWNAFAEEVYAVCPDVVDQGTGSVEDLASEMKRTHTLYLWWD